MSGLITVQSAPNEQGSLKPRVQFPLDSIHILTLTATKVQSWAIFYSKHEVSGFTIRVCFAREVVDFGLSRRRIENKGHFIATYPIDVG